MYHEQEPSADFTCEKCKKSFAGKGPLSKHIKYSMHNTMKNFQCVYIAGKNTRKKIHWTNTSWYTFPGKKCKLCNLLLSRDKLLIAKHMNMHFQKRKLKTARSFKRKTLLQKRVKEYLNKK